MKTYRLKRAALALPLFTPLLLTNCVWQGDYDALAAQNQLLVAENQTNRAEIARLQSAIIFTVESDMLFPSGGYQLSDSGKKIIAKFAESLAPTQKAKIAVNGYTDNTPVGPVLAKMGITDNHVLSEKRAQNVMEYMISQGVRHDLIEAHGYGEENPDATNDTAQGRAQNRRVELKLMPAA